MKDVQQKKNTQKKHGKSKKRDKKHSKSRDRESTLQVNQKDQSTTDVGSKEVIQSFVIIYIQKHSNQDDKNDQQKMNDSTVPSQSKQETPASAQQIPIQIPDYQQNKNNSQGQQQMLGPITTMNRDRSPNSMNTGKSVNSMMGIQVEPLSHKQNSAPLNYVILESQTNSVNKNTDMIIKRAPRLILRIIEGNAIPMDQQIEITPTGIINNNSQRLQYIRSQFQDEEEKIQGDFQNNDGCKDFTTYFGAYDINDLNQNDILETSKLNDYVVPKNEGFGRRHFMIVFSVEKNGYYLKDMGDGTGTFIKVDQQFILRNGHIISFGDSHMVVGLVLERKEKDREDSGLISTNSLMQLSAKRSQDRTLITQLMVQFIEGPKSKETYSFKQEEVPILIGRSHECKICFKEGNLSRIQSRIDFIDEKWILKDGNGSKPSTNGTWLFAGEEEKIYDGMIFKAGGSLFKVQLVHQ